jgi:chromosome partitioning protein
LRVVPARLSERAAFRHATGSGQVAQEIEPEGKAAAEITTLWHWICQQVNMPAREHGNMAAKATA